MSNKCVSPLSSFDYICCHEDSRLAGRAAAQRRGCRRADRGGGRPVRAAPRRADHHRRRRRRARGQPEDRVPILPQHHRAAAGGGHRGHPKVLGSHGRTPEHDRRHRRGRRRGRRPDRHRGARRAYLQLLLEEPSHALLRSITSETARRVGQQVLVEHTSVDWERTPMASRTLDELVEWSLRAVHSFLANPAIRRATRTSFAATCDAGWPRRSGNGCNRRRRGRLCDIR